MFEFIFSFIERNPSRRINLVKYKKNLMFFNAITFISGNREIL